MLADRKLNVVNEIYFICFHSQFFSNQKIQKITFGDILLSNHLFSVFLRGSQSRRVQVSYSVDKKTIEMVWRCSEERQ